MRSGLAIATALLGLFPSGGIGGSSPLFDPPVDREYKPAPKPREKSPEELAAKRERKKKNRAKKARRRGHR